MTEQACAATCATSASCRRHGCLEWWAAPGDIGPVLEQLPALLDRRHGDELTVPGPRPFDRRWLMRRLRLLDRWAS